MKKAEHRLVKFLLKEGLGITPEQKAYKQIASPRDHLLSFDMLRQVVPAFELNLKFVDLNFSDRPTLKSCLRRDEDCRLIQLLSSFESKTGFVFTFDGVKGGLILHDFELPSDRQSGSVIWDFPDYRVRLQRFAEFVQAMRSKSFSPTETTADSSVNVSTFLAELAMSTLKPLSVRTLLLIISIARDPELVRELQGAGYEVEYQVEEMLSYLQLPHRVLAVLLKCDESSAKRATSELVNRNYITRKRFSRRACYRFNGQLNWEVVA